MAEAAAAAEAAAEEAEAAGAKAEAAVAEAAAAPMRAALINNGSVARGTLLVTMARVVLIILGVHPPTEPWADADACADSVENVFVFHAHALNIALLLAFDPPTAQEAETKPCAQWEAPHFDFRHPFASRWPFR